MFYAYSCGRAGKICVTTSTLSNPLSDKQGVTGWQGAKRLGKEKAESGALTYMLSAREDAEFQQKASAEIQDVPNTIPAFK